MTTYLILIAAGLCAGGLNAIAGGGTFISFPALVWTGIPPIMANATATLTALPGYCASAWSFRKDLMSEGTANLKRIVIIASIGGVIGALLLLATSDQVFSGIVPYLLMLATIMFAFGQKIIGRFSGSAGLGLMASTIVMLVVSIYGGYFNGGLGIMLLACFTVMGYTNLHYMNGLKNLLSALLSVVSAAIFIASGLIDWHAALILGTATAAGGYIGGHYSTKVKNIALLKKFIIAVGVVLTIVFFIR